MKNKGITLISLVITIIILIILSSIAIYLSLGNNGIFVRSKQAKEETNKQTATELINLKITTAQMNKYAEKQEMPTLQELADVLYEDNEIEYIALETKVGNKEKVTVGEKTSIFTKLNEYPYEFEINSLLQLASIDGVKLATNSNSKGDSEVIWEGTTNNTSEIKVNWKPYRYIIFYHNEYSDSENFATLMSSVYSTNTLNLLKEKNHKIQLLGWDNKFEYITPTNEGFLVETRGEYRVYLKRIEGIY